MSTAAGRRQTVGEEGGRRLHLPGRAALGAQMAWVLQALGGYFLTRNFGEATTPWGRDLASETWITEM